MCFLFLLLFSGGAQGTSPSTTISHHLSESDGHYYPIMSCYPDGNELVEFPDTNVDILQRNGEVDTRRESQSGIFYPENNDNETPNSFYPVRNLSFSDSPVSTNNKRESAPYITTTPTPEGSLQNNEQQPVNTKPNLSIKVDLVPEYTGNRGREKELLNSNLSGGRSENVICSNTGKELNNQVGSSVVKGNLTKLQGTSSLLENSPHSEQVISPKKKDNNKTSLSPFRGKKDSSQSLLDSSKNFPTIDEKDNKKVGKKNQSSRPVVPSSQEPSLMDQNESQLLSKKNTASSGNNKEPSNQEKNILFLEKGHKETKTRSNSLETNPLSNEMAKSTLLREKHKIKTSKAALYGKWAGLLVISIGILLFWKSL